MGPALGMLLGAAGRQWGNSVEASKGKLPMKITQAVPAMFAWRPLHRALFYTLLLCIAALWAMPRSAHAQLYVSENSSTVGEYNATTGAAISSFTPITGLSIPEGIAVSGNNLFVAQEDNNTVGEYNATTGAAINASFITGVSIPAGLALSGNNLFVASQSGTVGEYDVSTNPATLINANFITGLNSGNGAYALALSGNNLFVANLDGSTVGEYNVSTNPATLIG